MHIVIYPERKDWHLLPQNIICRWAPGRQQLPGGLCWRGACLDILTALVRDSRRTLVLFLDEPYWTKTPFNSKFGFMPRNHVQNITKQHKNIIWSSTGGCQQKKKVAPPNRHVCEGEIKLLHIIGKQLWHVKHLIIRGCLKALTSLIWRDLNPVYLLAEYVKRFY